MPVRDTSRENTRCSALTWTAASAWNELIAPYGAKGSLLISPSMCHQADETFLTPFKEQITTDWDVTNLHINNKDMDGVNKVRDGL